MRKQIKCKQCDGSGSEIEMGEAREPCGFCPACERGDPIGCTRPIFDQTETQIPCRSCWGYGYYELEDC